MPPLVAPVFPDDPASGLVVMTALCPAAELQEDEWYSFLKIWLDATVA